MVAQDIPSRLGRVKEQWRYPHLFLASVLIESIRSNSSGPAVYQVRDDLEAAQLQEA
jgi:hypothetical protein